MTPEVWRQVNRIFDEVADLPPEAQPAAVRKHAGEDVVLEAEVLRLLRAMTADKGRPEGFLDRPLLDLHALLPETPAPANLFSAGAIILQRFEIRRFLASGGMGDVYEAWDRELDEAVALKTIRPQIARHAEVIERFKQEVRNARGISHPNICRVYEIFHVDGLDNERTWFLSMELVQGPTLLDCIHTKGCLPSAHALGVAKQLASGLEAAHQFGLVHRDFKSANVMLVEESDRPARAVIMDFGLSARALREEGVDIYAHAGTPGYMAPEQERGGDIGPLADQYAFGVVLCEMLSGMLPAWKNAAAEPRRHTTPWGRVRSSLRPALRERLGAEANVGHAPKAGLRDRMERREKPRLRLPAHRFSPRAERVIRRCLERDPACRFPDMRTAADTLVPPGMLGTPWRKAIAVCLLLMCALGVWRWRVYQSRCLICDVVQLTPDTDQSDDPSLSADGKLIAYSSDRASTGNLDIFVQALPSGPPVRLTHDAARDTEPSLSPDGAMVAFRSERNLSGIYIISTHGGSERLLIPDGRSPRFSPDGKNLLYWTGDLNPAIATGRMYRFEIAANSSSQIASTFQDARYPVWNPDGTKILFTGCASQGRSPVGCLDWWVANADGTAPVQTRAFESLRARGLLLSRIATGVWTRGEIIFGALAGSKRNLWSLALSSKDWQVHDEPKMLLQRNSTDMNPTVAGDAFAYTVVAGALHIWRIGQTSSPTPQEPEKITDDAQIDHSPFVSENGRFLVFERGRGRRDIVVTDTVTHTESVLLHADFLVNYAVIDSTGEWLAYQQHEQGEPAVYYMHLGSAGKLLCRDCYQPSGWLAGDRGFLYRSGSPSSIFFADPRTGRTQEVLHGGAVSLGAASWSSVTNFLLFTVTEGNRSRIAAVPLKGESVRADRLWTDITKSQGNAHDPCWSKNGRKVFYVADQAGSQTVFSQDFSPERRAVIGEPVALATSHGERRSIDNVTRSAFSLSAGGDSLYLNLGEETSTIQTGRRSTSNLFAFHNEE